MTDSAAHRLRGNICRYYLFQGAVSAFLFLPVIVLFWQQSGLGALQIYLLQGLFAVAVVLLEVPTGMVADRLGKRPSVIAGSALLAAGMLVYGVGASFAVFLLAEIILACGAALISGADTALLFDTLKALGREGEFRRVEGRARGAQLVSLALATVLGGFVGASSYRATLFLSAVGPVVALFSALGMVEASAPASASAGPRTLALLRDAARFVLKHRLVRWYVLFQALLGATGTWLLWLYQPYLQLVGLPVYSFGLVFAFFHLVSAASSALAQRFDDRLGPLGSLLGLGLLQLAPLVLMALVVAPWSFLFILGHQAVRGLSRPLIADRVLRYTYADKRATVLSLGSLAGRLAFAATAPIVGWAADVLPLPHALLAQAALLALILVPLYVAYARLPAKYFRVKTAVQERQ